MLGKEKYGNIGTPFEEQKAKIEENLTPYPKTENKDPERKIVGEDSKYYFKIFDMQLEGIAEAKDLDELQGEIVIINVNEFKLKDQPTPEDFDGLLNDFRKWNQKFKEDMNGTEEEKQQVWQKLEEVIEAARQKFIELSK